LTFDGGADEWPWRYHCEQRFALDDEGVTIGLVLENVGVSSMPAMLGLHPYFPNRARARLHARLPRVWQTDAAALPLEQIETPAAWTFNPGRPLSHVGLDHCFAGWDGIASIEWPDLRLELRTTGCRFLHVYSPPARDFFCIEPQTAPPGALERAAGEAAVLAPGEHLAIEVHLAPGEP
jgi:aldose 1-epimerase